MLWSVQKRFQDGTESDEIVHSESPYVIDIKKEKVISSMTRVHKYNYEHYLPPTLFINDNGRKYIMPAGIECHIETTMDDINWIKPKLKKEIEHIQGSIGTYKTTYDPNKKTYKCTCMGFWRSKGNCKHVKALKEKNK